MRIRFVHLHSNTARRKISTTVKPVKDKRCALTKMNTSFLNTFKHFMITKSAGIIKAKAGERGIFWIRCLSLCLDKHILEF